MDITFTDTFFKSFKRMINRERWYWKAYDACRYDIPRFVINFWKYRKVLWHTRVWDAHGSLRFMKTNLILLANHLDEYGHEIDEMRNKKVAKIRRAVDLLDHHINDDFIQLAEKQLNKKVTTNFNVKPIEGDDDRVELLFTDTEEEAIDNSKVFALSRKLERDTWRELFDILHGQDYEEFNKSIELLSEKEKGDYDLYQKWFDGSGLNGWWD